MRYNVKCNILLFILILAVFQSSCRWITSESLMRVRRNDLLAIVLVSCTPINPVMDWDEIHTVSVDSFGRELFLYKGYQGSIGEVRRFAFVCQKVEDEWAYFYDDICCLPTSDKENALDNTEFLSANNWNQPFCEEKMTRVKIPEQISGREDQIVEDDLKNHFSKSVDVYQSIVPVCEDDDYNRLYLYIETREGLILSITGVITHQDRIVSNSQFDKVNYLSQVRDFKDSFGFGKKKTYRIICRAVD